MYLAVTYLLAFNFHLRFWGVIIGRVIAEETVRVVMFVWRYRSGKWFKLEANREVVRETALT